MFGNDECFLSRDSGEKETEKELWKGVMKRKKVIKMFLVGVIIVGVVLGSQFRAITEEYCDNQSNKQKYNN